MGFDILIWGILLLLSPIYQITDAVAAVLFIAAFRKSGEYLTEMRFAERFSYAFLAVGLGEMIFSYIIPSDDMMGAFAILRAGILLSILLSIARGIRSLAEVAEDAILYDRAAAHIKPICVIFAAKMISLVLSGLFPSLSQITFYAGLCIGLAEAVLIIMIFRTVFKCYKDINIYPSAVADDEELS